MRGFWNCWNTKWLLNYHALANICRNVSPNLLKKRNLTAFPLILIPEYGQSNATLILMISSKVVRHHRQPTLVKNIVQVIHINVAPLTYVGQYSLTWVQSPFVKVADLHRGETQSLSNLFPLFSACNTKTYISVLISNSQAGPRYSKLTSIITETV